MGGVCGGGGVVGVDLWDGTAFSGLPRIVEGWRWKTPCGEEKEEEHEEREPRRSRLLAEGGEAPEGTPGGATAASVSQAQCRLGEEWPTADAVVDWWCSEWEIGLAGHLCPLRAGEGV